MTESSPVLRLDPWTAAFSIGHQAISTNHRTLVGRGRADEHTRSLLAESADITLHLGPTLMRGARDLVGLFSEQSLLAPEMADAARVELENELERIEPAIRRLQHRHQAIGRELVLLLDTDQ